MKKIIIILGYLLCFAIGGIFSYIFIRCDDVVRVPKYTYLNEMKKIEPIEKVYNPRIVSILARHIWIDRYGSSIIDEMEPYEVYENDSTWIVTGTNNHGTFLDGEGFVLVLDKYDGKIVRFYKER
ncbi:MAG: hypothetical protein IJ729_00670 [Alloprevotella sp.]|nr:hypothetical protein [Alloprevotella sp.]MBR1732247.1 hypothetical protein [Alloprevotella sp.]